MTELSALLSALGRQELTLEEVCRAVAEGAAAAPDQAPAFNEALLHALRGDQISDAQFGAISGAIDQALGGDDDRTRMLGGSASVPQEGDGDRTRVLVPKPADAKERAVQGRGETPDQLLTPDRSVDEDPTDMRRAMPHTESRGGTGDITEVRRRADTEEVTQVNTGRSEPATETPAPAAPGSPASDDDTVTLDPDRTEITAFNPELAASRSGAADEAAGSAGPTARQDDPDTEQTALNARAAEEPTHLGANAAESPDDDEETVLNAQAGPGGERVDLDATVVQAPDPPDPEVTVITPAEGDATVLTGADEDKTRVLEPAGQGVPDQAGPGDGSDVDFDILSPDAMAAARSGSQNPGSAAVTAAGTSTGGTQRPANHVFGEGDVLKDRFELVSMLGEGGMGAVWRAKDRLKEEARDRNPFVAVKLLQGDFKEHPEAFIALQRETSKQQRLAHPNVATVYDFDRDGDTVYMTMEVMEGQPMDAFVRTLPAEGLPPEEAMPLIEDICAGLAYAHAAGLVHSDLKPGNAFLVDDPDRKHGRVKLLDFGIARASKTKSDAEGETTLFDPGQLGALTPTYATIEMFEGMDPDPRDDIYALAIMAYQLFTGKHPYGRKSAPKAQELGLVPQFVETLDKRQNRGLVRGLAFSRDARTPTVEAFLDDIRKKKSRAGLFAGVGLAASIILAVGAYGPVTDYLDRQERERVLEVITQPGLENIRAGLSSANALAPEQRLLIFQDDQVKEALLSVMTSGDPRLLRESLELINQPGFEALRQTVQGDERANEAVVSLFDGADEAGITNGLALIAPFDPTWQRLIMESERVKDTIFGFYTGRMYEHVQPEQGRFDYQSAREVFDTLDGLYPDSAEVLRIDNELQSHRQGQIDAHVAMYREMLAAGEVLPGSDRPDISLPLAVVRQIAPDHPVLSDEGLASRVGELADEAVAADDYERARLLLSTGLNYRPGQPQLQSRALEVAAELQRRADAARALEIERAMLARSAPADLDGLRAERDSLLELLSLKPASEVLAQRQQTLVSLVGGAVDALRTAGRDETARRTLIDFARLLPTDLLLRLSVGAEAAAGAAAPSAELVERSDALDTLLAQANPDPAWELSALGPYRDLIAVAGTNSEIVVSAQGALVDLYQGWSEEQRMLEAFDAARAIVERGLALVPADPRLEAEAEAVAAGAEALRARIAEEQRLAQIEAWKQELLALAARDEPDAAAKVLEQLGDALPATDAFVRQSGPDAIGASYLRLAGAQRDAGQPDEARALARTGLQIAPGLSGLVEMEAELSADLMQAAQSAQAGAFAGRTPLPEPPRPAGTAATSSVLQGGGGASEALSWSRAGASEALPLIGSDEGVADLSSAGALVAEAQSAARSLPLDFAAITNLDAALSPAIARAAGERVLALAQAEPLDVGALAMPLDLFGNLFEPELGALEARLATLLDGRLLAASRAAPLSIAAAAGRLADYRNVLPGPAGQLAAGLAGLHGEALLSQAEAESFDIDALTRPLAEYEAAFPDSAAALRRRVGEVLAQSIVSLAQRDELDVTAVVQPLARYKVLFPESEAQLRARTGERLSERVIRMVEAEPLALARLEPHLEALKDHLPEAYQGARSAVASVSAEALVNLDVSTAAKISALRAPLGAFGNLFPEQAGDVKRQLAERASRRLLNVKVDSAARLSALAEPVSAFEELFPERSAAVRDALVQRVAGIIQATIKQDVFKADAMRRAAVEALPGSATLGDIRIELPLEEIATGREHLDRGRLNEAREMLAAATQKDSRHSDIPPFRDALEDKEQRARDAYEKYRELTVKRGSRKERAVLLATAKRLWKDNGDFVALKEPRSGLCTARLAGLGGSKRSVCFDLMSKRKKGPPLIVVPAGGGFGEVFAITKYEISINDFNQYCRATKQCKSDRNNRKAPRTGITADQARAYAAWLSGVTSETEQETIVYRLPTAAEWEYAAAATGRQPAKENFNCRVTSGNSIIKGHALTAANSGRPNAWGLTNYVGNAQEWVEKGAGVLEARGGAYTDELARCDLSVARAHDGQPDDITGFRLIREM